MADRKVWTLCSHDRREILFQQRPSSKEPAFDCSFWLIEGQSDLVYIHVTIVSHYNDFSVLSWQSFDGVLNPFAALTSFQVVSRVDSVIGQCVFVGINIVHRGLAAADDIDAAVAADSQ